MGLTRLPNWESILREELNKAKTETFSYGSHDCATWSAKVLRSYTDLTWKPKWANKKEALKQQKNEPMEKQVSKVLNQAPNINLMITQRGDLVQKGTGMKATLGICIGSKVAFVGTNEGLAYIDLKDCTYSWRI